MEVTRAKGQPVDSNQRKKRNNCGFTLIELLIVMIIIGLLAAFITPKLIGRVGESKQTAARAQIELLSTALEIYHLDTGSYPSQGSGLDALITEPSDSKKWKGPYLTKKKIPKDPWGEDYTYTFPGEYGDFDIISYGADGTDGGDGDKADILSWE